MRGRASRWAAANYTDSVGTGAGAGHQPRPERRAPAANAGLVPRVVDPGDPVEAERQAGFSRFHDALTGPFKNGPAVTSIHPFAAAYRARRPGSALGADGLLAGPDISARHQRSLRRRWKPTTAACRARCRCTGRPTRRRQHVDGLRHQPGRVPATSSAASSTCASPWPAAAATDHASPGPATADPDFVVYAGGLIARGDGAGRRARRPPSACRRGESRSGHQRLQQFVGRHLLHTSRIH